VHSPYCSVCILVRQLHLILHSNLVYTLHSNPVYSPYCSVSILDRQLHLILHSNLVYTLHSNPVYSPYCSVSILDRQLHLILHSNPVYSPYCSVCILVRQLLIYTKISLVIYSCLVLILRVEQSPTINSVYITICTAVIYNTLYPLC